MKIVCKHNGKILDDYGYGDKHIDNVTVLDEETIERVKEILRWRPTEYRDFEYGIGGFAGDEHFTIKHMAFANNNTEIVVRVTKKWYKEF